jgi:pimeloyl-ACP methyl ester carboxylesterase
VAALNDNVRQSRSDPVPMPRTAVDVVADLHALLRAAGVPGPYVFAGHSLGGLFVRLYASTYPREVLGIVLVDAYSERLKALLTPQRWAALVRLNVRSGSDTVTPIPSYGDLETIGFGKDNGVMRQAATSPMRVHLICRRRRRGFRRRHWNRFCVRRTKIWRRSSRTHASLWPKTADMISTKINQS